MNFLRDILNLINQSKKSDRIGPDQLLNHWKLYFRSIGIAYCKRIFLEFGEGSLIRPNSYIVGCSKVRIGKNVVIRPSTMIFAETVIEMNCSVEIEDNVLLASGVHIYVNDHKFDDPFDEIYNQGYYPDEKVTIKKGAWIGANAIILKGVTIGENAVVAAGSVVNKNVEPRTVVGGIPAKTIKKIVL